MKTPVSVHVDNYVSVSVIDSRTATINWLEHAQVQGVQMSNGHYYYLQIRELPSGGWTALTPSYFYSNCRVFQLTHAEFKPATKYQLQVQYQGSLTASIDFTMPSAAAGETAPVIATYKWCIHSITPNSAVVSWEQFIAVNNWSQGNYLYYVQITDKSGNNQARYRTHTQLYPHQSGIAECVLNNLLPSHTYTVTLYCNAGNGSSANFTTPASMGSKADKLEEDVKTYSDQVDRLTKENDRIAKECRNFSEESTKLSAVIKALEEKNKELTERLTHKFEQEKKEEEYAVASKIRGPSDLKALVASRRKFLLGLENSTTLLMLGFYGNGKSAFINTVLTSLSEDEFIEKRAASRNSSKHVTRTLKNFASSCSQLQILDSWGISEDSMTMAELEGIIEGNIGYDFEMGQMIRKNTKSTKRRCPFVNNVIIVVDAQDIEDNAVMSSKIREYSHFLQQRGYTPVIAMTKVDIIDPEFAPESNPFNSPKICKKMRLASQETGFPINCIFPVKNYSDEYERERSLEDLALFCISEAVRFGIDESTYSDLNEG
eukprot:TRINITY_DN4046_c1_g1_i1.p1 TRINITY_DN4046_c1_g1~~TRINITY_DN4046_c1_g1_i1.p1  ORF type:complete len:546 (-),score=143.72 TRINITY_DN4046_c1_g1_i1:84-1721(-)